MTDLKFVPFEKNDFALYASWFEDSAAQRWLSIPDDNWLTYVLTSSRVFSWMVYEDAQAVGQIQVDVSEDGTQASIAFLVPATHRHQGYGFRILRDTLSHPSLATVHCFEAGVQPDNQASIKLLTKASFKLASPVVDEDGFLSYAFHRA